MYSKILPKPSNSFFLLFLLLFTACKSDKTCKDCDKQQAEIVDSLDNFPKSESDTFADPMAKNIIGFAENKKKIEKKYGVQWDFCHCIRANDSLDQLIKNGVDLDEKFMKSFEEVDVKCKSFLVMSPNKTPDERALHEKKIKKCLNEAAQL